MDKTGTSAPDPPKSMTRRQLYDLVWSMPMSKLARSFGWSDVWLAKLCRQVGVPPPPRGYWAKKRAGKRVNRRSLPKKLDPDEVIFTWDDAVPDFEAEAEKSPKVELDEDVAAKLRELESAPPIELAPPDVKLHRLVVATDRAAPRNPPTEPVPHWMRREVEREPRKPPFSFEVGLDQRARALKILDAVVRMFEAVGLTFTVPRESEDRRARVSVLGEMYTVAIREPLLQRPFDPARDGGSSLYHPRVVRERSGRLVLELSSRGHARGRTWSDTPRRALEAVLSQVARTAVRQVHDARRAAIAAAEREERHRREEEQRRLEEERRRAEQERRRLEQLRVDALLEAAEKWRAAQDLRDFAAACAEAADARSPEMSEWLAWVDGVAARWDPLSDGLEHVRLEIDGAARDRPVTRSGILLPGDVDRLSQPPRRWHPNSRWPPRPGR